ncbi:protein of unknown function [Paenibacillus sophorae]|uniref:DUF1858 domain-containing protein n=1 Tax=Paenibacillus sophorae TaxID=1333845 RepID=A0A1H8Q6Y1_9BACL|nr:DUF1858 domain-containing protein [Paenibacillus sophorae]QWU15249.1 DUF1858 domain-containing protein [Paenibacillus sophorae]SEO49778.1 protein of unknown function [Paenibacillus sophorae]
MQKTLSINEPIFDLVTRDPVVKDIMIELGFQDIAKPGMLQTAGRFMTLAKGIKLKKMDIDSVKLAFQRHGFNIQE